MLIFDEDSQKVLIPLSVLLTDEVVLREQALRTVSRVSMGMSSAHSEKETLCNNVEDLAASLSGMYVRRTNSDAGPVGKVTLDEVLFSAKKEVGLDALGAKERGDAEGGLLWMCLFALDISDGRISVRQEVLRELRELPNEHSTQLSLSSLQGHNRLIDQIMNLIRNTEVSKEQIIDGLSNMDVLTLRSTLEGVLELAEKRGIVLTEYNFPPSETRHNASDSESQAPKKVAAYKAKGSEEVKAKPELSKKQLKAKLYGEALNEIHEKSGLKVNDVALKVGKGRTEVSRYLGGRHLPNLDVRMKLAIAYGEPCLNEEPVLPNS